MPETGRGRRVLSWSLWREWPWWHVELGLLASRTVRGYISVVLCHSACGTWLQQPQETNPPPCWAEGVSVSFCSNSHSSPPRLRQIVKDLPTLLWKVPSSEVWVAAIKEIKVLKLYYEANSIKGFAFPLWLLSVTLPHRQGNWGQESGRGQGHLQAHILSCWFLIRPLCLVLWCLLD